MQSLQELFIHELQDVWAAEQSLADALGRMSQEATSPELHQVFSTHLSETQTHISRLQQVFDAVGAQPSQMICQGMEGIIQEHNQFVMEHQPSPQTHSAFALGAGERIEHYEIAAYDGLIRLANAMGLQQAMGPLQANLADEREQLSRLQSVGRSMNLQQMASQDMTQQAQTGGGQRHLQTFGSQ